MTPQAFDLLKLVLAALLGFILGTGGNFIVYFVLNRDRRLRLIEREAKRHKFWKDFFETQAALPEAARYSEAEMQAASSFCQAELSRSYEEIMDHAFWANTYSRTGAVGILAAIFWFVMWGTDGDILRLLEGPPPPDFWPAGLKFGASLGLLAGEWYIVYSFFYRPMRDGMKRAMLDRQRQGKFRIKTLAEWIDEFSPRRKKLD